MAAHHREFLLASSRCSTAASFDSWGYSLPCLRQYPGGLTLCPARAENGYSAATAMTHAADGPAPVGSRFASLLACLDPRPDVRGKQFERICKWYLENAPEYRGRVAKVWLWKEWPQAWGIDAGIDLVAQTADGEFWAVQAKCYDPDYHLKKSDIDTFLAESSRGVFAFRLLIATTDLIGTTARRTLEGQAVQADVLLRSQLEAADLPWPTSPDSLLPAQLEPKRPRPHQDEAIRAVVTGFATRDRGQLIMPCGTGKTLIALWIAERLSSQATLVLVPSLSLLKQTLREWTANASTPFRTLPVCSDPSVSSSEIDALVSNTTELGFPVTSSPERIAKFLSQPGRKVIFSTYQSSIQIKAAQALAGAAFDLVVADESHRCAGPASSEFALILDETAIRCRRHLFMTATPRYFTGRLVREARQVDYEIASMDDEASFGPVFHQLTFGQAIKDDLLSDYQVVVVGVTDREAHDLAERRVFVRTDGSRVTDAHTLAAHLGLARAIAKYDLKKLLSFHGRVAKAREFANQFPAVVRWMPETTRPQTVPWTQYVSGEMPAGERERHLMHLRDLGPQECGLIANARCLNEGIDVPALDGIAFIDPRRSEIDIVQAVGRAIRRSEGKKLGSVVLPVLIGEGDEPEQTLTDSAFAPVWQVLKALRSHDDVLATELDALRRGLGRRGAVGKLPSKIVLDLPVAVGEQFARAFEARVVQAATVSWEQWLGLLESYVEREGHARVPASHIERGWRLGGWVVHQRSLFESDRLSAEHITTLQKLPGWTWDPFYDAWEYGFAKLTEHVRRHGDARINKDYVDDNKFRLGGWAAEQRTVFSEGKLSQVRRRRLEAFPGWRWNLREADWDEAFGLLRSFVFLHGSADVPSDHMEDGFRLGGWVITQRQFKARLPQDRISRLEALPGWMWEAREAAWREGLNGLEAFVAREGHANVPKAHIEDGFKLGQWVGALRQRYRHGRVSAERARTLQEFPGWNWNSVDATWEEGFAHAQRYVKREGHSRVPQEQVEHGFPLGQWVGVQRQAYRGLRGPSGLSSLRRQRLTDLPGWSWHAPSSRWEDFYEALKQFSRREAHVRVPTGHLENGLKLWQWIARQRQDYATRSISADRVQLVEAVAGWSWEPRTEKTDLALQFLQEFAAREGHARVPASLVHEGFPLGKWVRDQRTMFRRGQLVPQRRVQLESVQGWTWSPFEAVWEQGFESLKQYVKREGHALVPRSHMEAGFRLGAWVMDQRTIYRRGRYDSSRRARLEAMPGWSWKAGRNAARALKLKLM